MEEERYRPKREYNEAPTTDLTKASRPFCLPFKEQPQSQTPSEKSLLLVTQNLQFYFSNNIYHLFQTTQKIIMHPGHLSALTTFAKDCLLTGKEQRSSVCHHAENGLIHWKMTVDCPKVITSIGNTLFQTRLDQELGIIGQASLLHG